jgi:myosin heavy subunit
METLSNELRDLGAECSHAFLQEVYLCGISSQVQSSQRSSIRGVSVGSQFRTSLQSLVADLERTQPHYIRCIKPNGSKSKGIFAASGILQQLRYSGMMEAIRIRQEGYAFREEHEKFYNRFSVLLSTEDMDEEETGIVQLVQALSKRLNVTDADWQIGHSKIFLRRELAEKLERLSKLRVNVAARTLCRFGRRVALARLSSLLVHWMRFRLHMLRIYRKAKASSTLAASYRSFKQQKVYSAFRRAVVLLQAEQRRKQAIEQARKLRDPFCDMTFRDCRAFLGTEQMKLDEAVAKQNFRVAADLEVKM